MDYVIIGMIVGISILAILGYVVYRNICWKHESLKETIDTMYKRYLNIEAILTKPPPQQEIKRMFISQKDQCETCDISPTRSSIMVRNKDLVEEKKRDSEDDEQTSK